MAKKYLDRVSVSLDDNGAWWLEFYVDDIREAILVNELAVRIIEEREKKADKEYWDEHYRKIRLFDEQNAAQQQRAVDGLRREPAE